MNARYDYARYIKTIQIQTVEAVNVGLHIALEMFMYIRNIIYYRLNMNTFILSHRQRKLFKHFTDTSTSNNKICIKESHSTKHL